MDKGNRGVLRRKSKDERIETTGRAAEDMILFDREREREWGSEGARRSERGRELQGADAARTLSGAHAQMAEKQAQIRIYQLQNGHPSLTVSPKLSVTPLFTLYNEKLESTTVAQSVLAA
eukprot:4433232-Pleurochrysis_carterae.AAC.1